MIIFSKNQNHAVAVLKIESGRIRETWRPKKSNRFSHYFFSISRSHVAQGMFTDIQLIIHSEDFKLRRWNVRYSQGPKKERELS